MMVNSDDDMIENGGREVERWCVKKQENLNACPYQIPHDKCSSPINFQRTLHDRLLNNLAPSLSNFHFFYLLNRYFFYEQKRTNSYRLNRGYTKPIYYYIDVSLYYLSTLHTTISIYLKLFKLLSFCCLHSFIGSKLNTDS